MSTKLTNKTPLYLAGVTLVVTVLIAGFWLSNRTETSTTDQKNKENSNSTTQVEEKSPTPPTTGKTEKTACEYFDEGLAKQTLGDKAAKLSGAGAPAEASLTYNTSICEYKTDNSKAVVILYRHPLKENVAKTLSDLQSRQLTAKSKDAVVVSAEVTADGKSDKQRAEKLVDQVVSKL
jgi:hypothetical protein